ncbi:MAG: cytochrome C [Acidobacteriota bacterium]
MVLTTASAVVLIVVFLGDLFGLHTNPYLGILLFLFLPAVFVLGLVLIPAGAWIERRRRAAGKPASSLEWPRIDLNDSSQRATAVIVFCLTTVNIVVVSLAAYGGVEYMDTVGFCGSVCHTPMQPELTAHLQGPHAGITCVACHVGRGPSSFANAKLSGVHRLLAVVRNNYSRPIVAAPENLVPARDTCEGCHAPARFRADRINRIADYADDAGNTESVTTLRMHLGGTDGTGRAAGIHWHASRSTIIEYLDTGDRDHVIPWVKVTDQRAGTREYAIGGVTPEQLAKGVRRRMECTDCHNRPSHAIAATAERAVDRSIARGEIGRTLPFVRREAVKALKASYTSEDAALTAIAQSVREFYQTQPAPAETDRGPSLDRAVLALQNIYRRSVFPDMQVSFGTYANNIGHVDSPGCFRCHDDEHVSKDGRNIGQDCETCHALE